MSNCVTKEELDNAAGAYTYNLASTSNFIALKAEIDMLDVNKLVNVPTGLKNLKTKEDD